MLDLNEILVLWIIFRCSFGEMVVIMTMFQEGIIVIKHSPLGDMPIFVRYTQAKFYVIKFHFWTKLYFKCSKMAFPYMSYNNYSYNNYSQLTKPNLTSVPSKIFKWYT
jgi:hypothetical protein